MNTKLRMSIGRYAYKRGCFMLIKYLTIIVDIQACNNMIHNIIIMQRNKLTYVHIILTNN